MSARRARSARSPGLRSVAVAAAVVAAGCAVGPTYHGPPPVAPISSSAPDFVRAGAAPVDHAAPPLADWWTALNDPLLDALERRALQASPTLDVAAARVRGARAMVSQDAAALVPSGGATAMALRARVPFDTTQFLSGTTGTAAEPAASGAATSTAVTFHSVGADATWVVDLFGGLRRQVRGARDQVGANIAQFEDAQVMLTSDVATAYLNVRDNQNRLRLGDERVAALRRVLELTMQQREAGTTDDSSVANARNQLETAEAGNQPLRAGVQMYADQLAAYLGQEPGTLDGELTRTSPWRLPLPPAETAVGDPASLLRRRPDIRYAERTLAASNEAIGANMAQYFPQLQLLGALSFGAASTNGLLEKRNLTVIAGPSLSWNFFDIPATRAKVRQARAQFEQAEATYRSTVLNALRDAENGLSQYGFQRASVVDLNDAAGAALRNADIYRERYARGAASLRDTLNQQQAYLQSAQTLAQNEAMLTSYWISLQSKLGLGWGVAGEASRGVAADSARAAPTP